MNADEAIDLITERLKGLIPFIEEAGAPSELAAYLTFRKGAFDFAVQENINDKHFAWAPILNGCNEAGDIDFIHWIILYRHLSESLGFPAALFHCYSMAIEAPQDDCVKIRVEGLIDAKEDDGNISERFYAAALVGAEEDWWDYDLLSVLPERCKEVQAVLEMEQAIMLNGDGEPEAWLVEEEK